MPKSPINTGHFTFLPTEKNKQKMPQKFFQNQLFGDKKSLPGSVQTGIEKRKISVAFLPDQPAHALVPDFLFCTACAGEKCTTLRAVRIYDFFPAILFLLPGQIFLTREQCRKLHWKNTSLFLVAANSSLRYSTTVVAESPLTVSTKKSEKNYPHKARRLRGDICVKNYFCVPLSSPIEHHSPWFPMLRPIRFP